MNKLEFIFKADGLVDVRSYSILEDLFNDYAYFRGQAEQSDAKNDPLTVGRMARASVLAFYSYFDGVLNRWIALFDPGFFFQTSLKNKIERIVKRIYEINSVEVAEPVYARSKQLRNTFVHLKLGHDDAEVFKALIGGDFFREIDLVLDWLHLSALLLGYDLHFDSIKAMKPYIDPLGSQVDWESSSVDEQADEEAALIADMAFRELDAQEAADGRS